MRTIFYNAMVLQTACLWNTHLCVLKAPLNWTTSKCLAAVEWNSQHCAEISRFKLGCVRLAFKPGPDCLAPADAQQEQDSQ